MGAIRSPRSWDLPEATGEGGGYSQMRLPGLRDWCRDLPHLFYRGWGSWGTGISALQEWAKRPRSRSRFVLSHGSASENLICWGEQPLPLILLSDIYEISLKSRERGLQQPPSAKREQS